MCSEQSIIPENPDLIGAGKSVTQSSEDNIFGPWMLAKKPVRKRITNPKNLGQRMGDSGNQSADRVSPHLSGSRFSSLMHETKNTMQPQDLRELRKLPATLAKSYATQTKPTKKMTKGPRRGPNKSKVDPQPKTSLGKQPINSVAHNGSEANLDGPTHDLEMSNMLYKEEDMLRSMRLYQKHLMQKGMTDVLVNPTCLIPSSSYLHVDQTYDPPDPGPTILDGRQAFEEGGEPYPVSMHHSASDSHMATDS